MYWNGSSCKDLLSFNNETCSNTYQCVSPMVCKLSGLSCSCPTTVPDGKCDCPIRQIGAEYYSLGSSCSLASEYGETCAQNFSCQYLTQNTYCSGTCRCSSSDYFNKENKICQALVSYYEACSQVDACNSNVGLSCQNALCKCNSSQFWNTGACVNRFTYNTGTCSADNQCLTNLTCKITGSSCLCPSTVINGNCDCPTRISGSEYYWDGSNCAVAKTYNQTCTASYTCKTLTEGTICTGTPLRCLCSSSQYFRFTTSKCENLLSINATCSQVDACNSNVGLSCQNALCKCNSSQFWSTASFSCIDYFNYGFGTCTADNQCLSNLTCRISGSSCLCPNSVVNGKCDCPTRVSGSEFYWDGSFCVSASSYNQSCHTSDYTCKVLKEKTFCDTTLNKCLCSTNYFWNTTSKMCVTCPTGWVYHRGSCFFDSTLTIKNPEISSNFNALRDCSEASARLAILYNSDLSNNFYANFNKNEYWVDFYRDTTGSTMYHSADFESNSSWTGPAWGNPMNSNEQCASLRVNKNDFKSHKCSDDREVLCEIIL